MYTCKDCKAETPMDYFAPDGVTCLDCIDPDDLTDQQHEQEKYYGGEDV